MTQVAHDLVADYLKRLKRELADLPRAPRRELLDEIAEHIAESPTETEIDVRNLLERLGDPAEIADEARGPLDVPRRKSGAVETGALILLPLGGLLVGVGWLVGVALLWSSNVWTAREKLLGTLVVPGGLALAFPFFSLGLKACGGGGGHETCTGGLTWMPDLVFWLIMGVIVIGPFITVGYLARQMRRRTA